ncbi:hypothetical protein [Mycobacterium colombiense]|uniref:hypothetical protein n=1 Tax=Mycobacterium colombiense TaxID=339268 RepID=UPI001E57F760|nr:hypothetical protein [Mycobacterium colombiense]
MTDGVAEVIRFYNLWRRIANFVGNGPYDEAEWVDDRLYFRSDYSGKLKKWPEWAEFGDWAAWIIAPKSEGYICVLHSLKHEREAERNERIEVMFSRFSDAGKYVISRLGDGIRSHRDIRLKSLFLNWEARGLDSQIRVESADLKTIDFLTTERPTMARDYAEQHLRRYTLEYDPDSYGFALDYEQPRMEVLALSFDELTSALLEGMPDSITSQVPLWRE